jgi:hypothetical protein
MGVAGFAAFSVILASGTMRCPSATLLGIPCPTCGMTRATLALLRLRFDDVLRYNPVAPLLVGLLAAIALRAVFVVARDGNAAALAQGRAAAWMLRALVVTFVLEIGVWGLRFFGWFGGPCPV